MIRKRCRGFVYVVVFAVALSTSVVFAQAQSITVSASPSSITIYPGEQNVPITVSVNSGDNDSDNYTGPVVVTMTGLPSGVTVTPVTLTPGNSGTIYLNASVSAGQEGFTVAGPSSTTSWTAQVNIVATAGAAVVNIPFSLSISISNPSFAPAPSAINLPIVRIDTGGVPIVSKTTDIPGTITITSADSETTYLPNSSDGDNTATFHVHGNSTSFMPKLPYHVKLNTSIDLLATMGLQCPYITNGKGKATCDKSKSYVLLANYDDKTFLRDWAASALANAIPIGNGYLNSPADSPSPSGTSALMPWAPHSLFVELYLNGVYEGDYQLIEEVKVDSHRVNITEMTDTDTSGDSLTGGYLLEIDKENNEDFMFDTPQGLDIGLVDPDFSPEVPEQTSYADNYVSTAETSLFSSNFTDPTLGWRAYFDEASAVNFYIVNDVMGNVDGGNFSSSDYFYKDINNPLLYMGPVWDFDISSGNVSFEPIMNPTVPWMQTQASWYVQWFKDPGFKTDVVTQWNTLKNNGVFTTWLASIQQEAATLDQSQTNNFGRWPMQGIEVWPDAEAAGSYSGEVSYLLNWLELRIAYLDSVFNNKAQTATSLVVSTSNLRNGSPATLNAQVSGQNAVSGTVSFLANNVLLGTASLSGGSASLTTSNLPIGADSLQAIYSGDDKNGLSASTPQTQNVAAPLIATVTSLAGTTAGLTNLTAASLSVSVVTDSGTTTPTGTVAFMNGSNLLGSVALANGTAAFSGFLPVGSDTITAVYSGDANYQGSTSNSLAVSVVGVPDFTLDAPSTLTNNGSSTITIPLTLTALYGFHQPVNLSCTINIPAASCSFSSATVTPGDAPASSAVIISLHNNQNSQLVLPLWTKLGGGLTLALFLWPFRRRRLPIILAIALLFSAGLCISACNTNTSTAGSVTVSASGGGMTHTATINLIITK